MLVVVAQTRRFHGVCNLTVQHSNSSDFGVECNSDNAQRIVVDSRNFSGASCSMAVLVTELVAWRWVPENEKLILSATLNGYMSPSFTSKDASGSKFGAMSGWVISSPSSKIVTTTPRPV